MYVLVSQSNMHVYLKLYTCTSKTSIFDNEIYNHTRLDCFIKDLNPSPVAQILKIMLNFNLCCVCFQKGAIFMLLFFVILFFEFRAKHEIILLPNKQNLEEYFHRQHM